jgi:hypothetical protein
MAGRWFSPGTLVSSTIITDCHNIAEISLKVALNTITINMRVMVIVIYCQSQQIFSFIVTTRFNGGEKTRQSKQADWLNPLP